MVLSLVHRSDDGTVNELRYKGVSIQEKKSSWLLKNREVQLTY